MHAGVHMYTGVRVSTDICMLIDAHIQAIAVHTAGFGGIILT